MLAICDHLDKISVCHVVSQATLLPLCTKYGQPLANSLGSKTTGQPFPDFTLGIQIAYLEAVEPRIKEGPAYRFGRQTIEALFLCVIRMQLLNELPVFLGIRTAFPQDALPARAVEFKATRMIEPRCIGSQHLAHRRFFQQVIAAVVQIRSE